MGSPAINEQQVLGFLEALFADDLHAKRVLSLSLATLGVIHAASLSVYAIGQALGMARGKKGKHGVKQVDRPLSNTGVDVWRLFARWVPYVLGQREEAVVSLDWTDFDDDDHTTLVASPRTRHGRSTPLVWMTVHESTLKGMRNDVEDLVLQRLREVIASDVKVTILADRGFADQDCMRYWSNWASSMWCAFVRQSRSPAPRGNAGRRPSGCRSAEVPKGCTTNLRSSIEGVM